MDSLIKLSYIYVIDKVCIDTPVIDSWHTRMHTYTVIPDIKTGRPTKIAQYSGRHGQTGSASGAAFAGH